MHGLLIFFAAVAPAAVPRFEPGSVADGEWPRAEPAAVGLDPAALDRLLRDAEASRSDALLILKDGRLVVERYFGQPPGPIPVTSVSKSVLSMLVGQLIAAGRIPSLDAPLSTWFPEWAGGEKARVTVRHLLTHTSGLAHRPATGYLRNMADLLVFLRKSPLAEEPGGKFSYNNEATQLLLGVVEAATGARAERSFQEQLFGPLGITDWQWPRDAAGNLLLEDLSLRGRDLVRLGQAMCQRGAARGRRVIPPDWVTRSTEPASGAIPSYGFLWWLFDGGFKADGWLGQYIVVLPAAHLVAVRQHRASEGGDEAENQRWGFRQFTDEVRAMVTSPAGAPRGAPDGGPGR